MRVAVCLSLMAVLFLVACAKPDPAASYYLEQRSFRLPDRTPLIWVFAEIESIQYENQQLPGSHLKSSLIVRQEMPDHGVSLTIPEQEVIAYFPRPKSTYGERLLAGPQTVYRVSVLRASSDDAKATTGTRLPDPPKTPGALLNEILRERRVIQGQLVLPSAHAFHVGIDKRQLDEFRAKLIVGDDLKLGQPAAMLLNYYAPAQRLINTWTITSSPSHDPYGGPAISHTIVVLID